MDFSRLDVKYITDRIAKIEVYQHYCFSQSRIDDGFARIASSANVIEGGANTLTSEQKQIIQSIIDYMIANHRFLIDLKKASLEESQSIKAEIKDHPLAVLIAKLLIAQRNGDQNQIAQLLVKIGRHGGLLHPSTTILSRDEETVVTSYAEKFKAKFPKLIDQHLKQLAVL